MSSIIKTLLWVTIFSVAMAYLETSVVVYLRKVYYPHGFKFPLIPIEQNIAITEFWREVSTIIMLICAGVISGKNTLQKISFFIYCFAVWDIFYYVFLKLLLDWPESLFTWDILFLIPVPWVGPVIAPCIISLTLILLALTVVYFAETRVNVTVKFTEWILLVLGSLIAIFSFIWDYVEYVYQGDPTDKIWSLSSKENMFKEISSYIPHHFNWWMFLSGEMLLLTAIVIFTYRMKNHLLK